MIGTTIAFVCTFFKFLDVPVYWPVLAMYFVILFVLTMKKQIMVRTMILCVNMCFVPVTDKLLPLPLPQHMIKYKYLPFSYGKRRYKGKDDTGTVVSS